MTNCSLKAIALCLLLASSALSQERQIRVIDWIQVRGALEAYSRMPSVDNADRVLAAMPNDFGYDEGDRKEFVATFRYILYGRPFKVLNKLVQKGDRSALRIAFRTLYILTNAEDKACILIGKSIRANALMFLEELKASGLERIWLDLIVTGYGWGDEGYPELSRKEIRLRLRSLQSVDRPELLDIRDICISILRKRQESLGYGKNHGAFNSGLGLLTSRRFDSRTFPPSTPPRPLTMALYGHIYCP